MLKVAEDRAKHLAKMLEDILHKDALSPGLAGKLWGRLAFSTTQMFGKFGRAKLRPFSRRQHEVRQHRLNPQLRSALIWWLEQLPRVLTWEV